MQLKNFDIDLFLRDYWQQKPLLIKNPWSEWINPLEPDELAGLSCEEEVESRLITQQRGKWNLEHGPIPEARFAKLGEKNWTLLVQAVDHYVPEVAALLDQFRFIPNWRIDDVMVSYAADNGGVGPHFDQYDVFLIQGLGQRRWQIGRQCDHTTTLLPHDDLRLLAQFETEAEWVLEPGDILYVPPRYAHNGVAVGSDCMTYSIGFRAPGRSELISHWCDHLLADLNDDDRYGDPKLIVQQNPGEISAHAIEELQAMILEKMQDQKEFARWLGQYVTTRKYVDFDFNRDDPIEPSSLRDELERGIALIRNPASRFAFIRVADGVLLFIDGNRFECNGETAALAEQLCAQSRIAVDAHLLKSSPALALLTTLYNQGCLAFDDDECDAACDCE